ncbi:FAD:protein FMN transferase [Azospirillum sp. RWY-5-1]|uniref:FAD:protein FMN transferase n=1 Tax=Azospirillum oleiclasticum TaxID=2735135 RepID=A0ABX2T9K4_9PROT|nr:FAD:protein FMN transferase [Azospirillum oleiclasticum]NYZ13712.1 FAD:protein FMN transferase [Azospirillum oleiclasticum]NYZ20984.1 FAD:protein FMN transferase [Azospirillum oleiclasticum]
MTRLLSRRRVLAIGAAAAGLALLPNGARAAGAALRVWRGTALGASASITLHHPDSAEADRLIALCLDEIARLERVFSLYRADSALARLNRDGELRDPPADLVRLLSEAAMLSEQSDGAFDVTVQPLWQLHATHFGRPGADPAGPPPSAVTATLRLVGHRGLRIASDRVWFDRRGMAVTLNGIAQGCITDRVADLLRAHGMRNVLLDLGEVRALDRHPDGRPWSVGLERVGRPGSPSPALTIEDAAVATSAGYGTGFGPRGRFTHLFDPATGASPGHWRSVTVVAPTATTADALSTTLSVLPPARVAALLAATPQATAYLTRPDGTVVTAGG